MGIRRDVAVPTRDGYEFDPSEWLRDAERYLTTLGYTEPESVWHEAAPQARPSSAVRRIKIPKSASTALSHRLAEQLRRDQYLYELTAALIAPYTVDVYARRTDTDVPRLTDSQLLGIIERFAVLCASWLETASQGSEASPWQGLAELLLPLLTHDAIAEMEVELGTQALSAMNASKLAKALEHRVIETMPPRYRVLKGQLLLYIQDLSRSVVEGLGIARATSGELELLLGLGQPRQARQPKVADAFPEGEGTLPNNPLVVAGLEAIYKGGSRARTLVGGWALEDSGRPVYTQNFTKGGRILVYPGTTTNAAAPLPTSETLWAFVESLTPFTSDVALAVMAQLCEPSVGDRPKYPLLESVRITADSILRYKGIQRWGAERRVLQERVFHEMERLRALQFDVEKYPTIDPITGKKDTKGASWQGDRLFDIVKAEQYQESLFGERDHIEVTWLVRAGQWAYWWLNAEGRVWVARMARVLLELDHREVRGSALMAKKIGQRLVLMNEALRLSGPLPLRIDRLLERIGELPLPEERSRNWAGRTRDRFDEAVLALQEAGVFAEVSWPGGYGPGDPDRGRGWVDRWLAAKVVVALPEKAPELAAETGQKALPAHRRRPRAPKPPQTKVSPINGAAIRTARNDRYLSQKSLAQHLGISVPYLSQIEGGKRVPSPELVDKLNAWLAES